MPVRQIMFVFLATTSCAFAQVFAYECDTRPVQGGWELIQAFCDPHESVANGRLVHHVELCDGYEPPGGQRFDYTRSLVEFLGVNSFFVEWQAATTGPSSEIPYGAPYVLSIWNGGSVYYHCVVARDRMRFLRDNSLPVLYFDVNEVTMNTFRIELATDMAYYFYIDGRLVDSGSPEGRFTTFEPQINIGSKSAFVASTTAYNYIRYGVTQIDASGDFDSDGDHDLRDFYFLHECILGVDRPVMADGGVDPGCLWADVNEDQVVDLLDFAEFQIAHSNSL